MRLCYVAPDGTAADLPFDAPVAIGRARDAQIPLLHPSVSRAHASLAPEGGAVVIRDLNSRNGVYVNGHKIADRVLLKTGDRLQIGELRFILALPDAPDRPATLRAETADQPTAQEKPPSAPEKTAVTPEAPSDAAAPATAATPDAKPPGSATAAAVQPAAPAKPAAPQRKKIVFKLK